MDGFGTLKRFKMSLQYISCLLLLFLQVLMEIFSVLSKYIHLEYVPVLQVGKHISA